MNNSESTEISPDRSAKSIIEAALFLASEPVHKSELLDLTGLGEEKLDEELDDIRRDLSHPDRGLRLSENNDKYCFRIKRELLDMVKYLAPHQDMSRGVLRTLSVIAYNSPVLQKEVVDIRGNGAYDHIDQLIERNFIKSEKEGRTKLLSVTQYFLDYFELNDLDELREGESVPQEYL
ncbi:MAG: SMC-Scp complex subunit ScpB [Candidatus Bipolaricaulota bacterium]|nr:SMC-Scp complex subunit ScpB [Candidatus Bipolaricaulota bacterium]MBS3791813.1 SMC-Scp complex subunit ScpB [Candidatus Bipolaricaulota bacterium]